MIVDALKQQKRRIEHFCYVHLHTEVFQHQGGAWEYISSSAADLVGRLLTVDPEKRISAAEALNHEWICDREYKAPKTHLHETVEQIRRYNLRRKLKASYRFVLFSYLFKFL